MNKKIIYFSFIIMSLFLGITNSYALSLQDGSSLSHDNFRQFVEELGYDYWRDNIGSDYFAIIPSKSGDNFFRIHLIKAPTNEHQQQYDNNIAIACKGLTCQHEVVHVFKNPDSISFSFPNTYFVGVGTQELDYENAFSTFYFKSYDGNSYLLEPNFDNTINSNIKYNINFNVPAGSVLVVKDLEGNIIEPTSDNLYSLEAGDYVYNVSKEGFYSKENVLFNVNSEITIDITLDSKLNNTSMQSIFSQYYMYISNLVNDLFSLENPLFLYLISFIIGFSILTFMKKLLGGS